MNVGADWCYYVRVGPAGACRCALHFRDARAFESRSNPSLMLLLPLLAFGFSWGASDKRQHRADRPTDLFIGSSLAPLKMSLVWRQ